MSSYSKSMGSYILFACRDAASISNLIEQEFGLEYARKVFEKIDVTKRIDFELKNEAMLAEFIQKSETQRATFLRKQSQKISKDTLILFVVLAWIGIVRAKDVMEVRDRYRDVLAPGRGNRITISSIYSFACEIRDTQCYDWPLDLFGDRDVGDVDE